MENAVRLRKWHLDLKWQLKLAEKEEYKFLGLYYISTSECLYKERLLYILY